MHQANKVRKKISNIEKNIDQLHSKSQVNWSKLDLKEKYLSNGSNFDNTYNRGTHTLFDYLKIKDVNNFNSQNHYNKVISGYPYEYVSKEHKFQKDSLYKLCPGAFGSKSSVDFSNRVANKNKDSMKNLNQMTSMFNIDQKLIYSRKWKSKYSRTDTVTPEGGKKCPDANNSIPFHKNFNFNTQSKLRNAESKRPHTSMVNHSRDKYDALTRMRSNKTVAAEKVNAIQGCNKSQTISAFNHIGRIYAPNFSREYQKAYTSNQNQFNRPKGMWAEMLNASQKHAFIANPFGNRSHL